MICYTINWPRLRSGERGLETISLERQDVFPGVRALDQLAHLTSRQSDQSGTIRLMLGAREMILPGGISGSFQVLRQKKGT